MSQVALLIFSLGLTHQNGQFLLGSTRVFCLCPEERKDLTLGYECSWKYILKFIYYNRGQRTIIGQTLPAGHLYMAIYICKWSKKFRREIFCNTWKLFEIQISRSIVTVSLEHRHVQSFILCLWLLLYSNSTFELLPKKLLKTCKA